MVLKRLTRGLVTALRHQLKWQIAGCCVRHGIGFAEEQVVYLSRIASQGSSMQRRSLIQESCHSAAADHTSFSLLGKGNLLIVHPGACKLVSAMHIVCLLANVWFARVHADSDVAHVASCKGVRLTNTSRRKCCTFALLLDVDSGDGRPVAD